MSYESIVYRILIASPSDVDEEREVAARVIQDWNDLNSFNKKIVLLPIRWETHSSPTYGVRPQESINKQIVDDCDLLVGFFWTKIGTPTGEDISGTIEEIKRVSNAGKPVMLYFSKRGKDPSLIDLQQLQALNKFKDEVYKIALVENYNSIVEFRDKISRQLEMKIRELQERADSTKELITFAFIDNKTGKLSDSIQGINIEKIEVSESNLNKVLKLNKKFSENKWHYNHYLASFIKRKNSLPIILGLENNYNRVLQNVVLDLKLKTNEKDGLTVEAIGSYFNSDIFRDLNQADLSPEAEMAIRKMFRNSLNEISSNIWELSLKPFLLLPHRTKVIESVILLHPKMSMSLEFSITLFSESILQTINKKCELNINVKKRELAFEEIKEIVEKFPEPEDLPF